MIFVTVGNTDPFDRLIRAVDSWIQAREQTVQVFAQIGDGEYIPRHCEYARFLTPLQFQERFREAPFVLSHAGMGTIITALEYQKPLIILPKRAELGEQRNDHQLATARRFRRSATLRVADRETDLPALLEELIAATADNGGATTKTDWPADPRLIEFVRDFIRK
jgi:UDP-N-acetylglucosamine transferase subunit ALG13